MIVVQIVADKGSSSECFASVKCHKLEPDLIVSGNIVLHTVEPISLTFSGRSVLSRRWSLPRTDINDWCEIDEEATQLRAEEQNQSVESEVLNKLKDISIAKKNTKNVDHKPKPETPKPRPKPETPVSDRVFGIRHIDLDDD